MPSTRPDRNAARPCANITATWSGPRPNRHRSPPRPPSRTRSRRRSSAPRDASEDPGDHQPKNDEENQKAENREWQFAENGVAARHHGHHQNDDERDAEGVQARGLDPESRQEGIAAVEPADEIKTRAADDDEQQDAADGGNQQSQRLVTLAPVARPCHRSPPRLSCDPRASLARSRSLR